jgi:hypothetical protein
MSTEPMNNKTAEAEIKKEINIAFVVFENTKKPLNLIIDDLTAKICTSLNYSPPAPRKVFLKEGLPKKDNMNIVVWDNYGGEQSREIASFKDGVFYYDYYNDKKREAKNIIAWLDESPLPEGKDESVVRIIHNGQKWYWCKCESCGWENSSEYADGGTPIADTGDHSDPICPVCGSNKIEGESKFFTDERYTKTVVEIPFDEFIHPYKKAIERLNDLESEKCFPPQTKTARQIAEEIKNLFSNWEHFTESELTNAVKTMVKFIQ